MAARIGKGYGGPWYSNYRDVVRFERGVKDQYPSFEYANKRSGHHIWREYKLTIDLQDYESRNVIIKMKPNCGIAPKVTADGPVSSPHRYENDDGELCMWYPYDPKEQRWVFADGLLHLIVLAEMHLYREAWWRETGGDGNGEWLGPEVPH